MGAWKLTDWNDIITQVNTLAQSPPAGCSAQSPLDFVTAPHRWSKDDIQQVQTTLKAICSNNTFAAIPDEWKQSSIDEINTAIAAGWCNCGCPCPNVEPAVTFFLGTWTAAGCTQADDSTYDCNPSGGMLRQAWAYGQQAASYYSQYADQLVAICGMEKQLRALNAELVKLIAALPPINETPTPEWFAAEAKVQAKQAEIQTLQTNISTTRQAAVASYKDPGDAAADQSMNTLAGLALGNDGVNIVQNFFLPFAIPPNVDTGWPTIDPNTCCNPIYCPVTWALQWRCTATTAWLSSPTGWANVVMGRFGPTGKPYLLWSFQCPVGGNKLCYSTNCSVGMTLPLCQGSSTYAVQLVISYPVA